MSLGLADPRAIRLRLPRRPGGVAILAAVLLMPALLLPNAQNEVLAQRQELRDAAEREAQRLEDTAQRLSAGRSETDPRVEVANELRELIRDLRDRPEDLDRQLARLGSLEDALRARIDPANEQRGAAIAALSRSLSRLATGDDGNPTGDVPKTKEDLEQLQDRLGGMTEAERNQLAEDLAELDGLAGQAGTEARAALSDATSALRRGDTQAAADALARLGEVLEGSQNEVEINRDLAATASDLQGARRALAEAGQRGQPGAGGRGQQGQRGEGQAGQGGQGEGGQSGQGQGGQGQGGQGQGGQGQGGQGQGGQGQGGQGQGGNGQGGQGGGSLGGGGSGARHLGSGASQGGFGGPTLGNRQFSTGELDEVFAPVERLGQPGDPSYIAGSGGDGQSQEGHGEGQGTNNESVVPYVEVYQEFRDFAITTLDRSYVPLDVKDYVRDYFTSLDPE